LIAEMRDSSGWTALHDAAWKGYAEVVNKLVSVKDLDVDIQVDDGRTALYMASPKGHLAIVNILLDTGASFNVHNQDGWVPLHTAADRGNIDVVKRLLQAGASVDSATKHGFTPLMLASSGGHTTLVKHLLDAKADVAMKDENGWSAFHAAVDFGNMEISGLLLPDVFNSPLASISVAIPVPLKDKLYQHFQLCISALRAYPTDQYFHRTLANLYFRAGDRQMALATYDESLRLNLLNSGKTRSNVLQINFCDECGTDPIRGPRYKCIICNDFDLCQQCFRAIPTRHPEHSFLAIPSKSWKESMNTG
jgi:Ankyrin repeats (3 copies)/Zinc finger, ZZ type/Ankyrin repeats (many copies)